MKAAVIVINLDRDTERLAFMREQFERLRIGYERFAALRGDDLPEAMRDGVGLEHQKFDDDHLDGECA